MKKLKLTTRWQQSFAREQERVLEIGQKIEYYGHNNVMSNNPEIGCVDEDSDGFFIVWETAETDTRIDGSERSNDILKNCGFTNV